MGLSLAEIQEAAAALPRRRTVALPELGGSVEVCRLETEEHMAALDLLTKAEGQAGRRRAFAAIVAAATVNGDGPMFESLDQVEALDLPLGTLSGWAQEVLEISGLRQDAGEKDLEARKKKSDATAG